MREVIGPQVEPGVEQDDYFACFGVHTSEIWALVKVAVKAGKRKIIRLIRARMLPSDDVLDMKCD